MVNLNSIALLEAAMEHGISSLSQLRIFLLACKYEGCDFSEMIGYEPSAHEFKAQKTHLIKLMRGAKLRGYDGLNLLVYGETTRGKMKQVILSAKGRRLRDILEQQS